MHVSLVGSAARAGAAPAAVADLDIYVVVPAVDRELFDAMVAAATALGHRLGAQEGRPWSVETRRGPFKPEPGPHRARQVHLLLDDRTSLAGLAPAVRYRYAATCTVLAGTDLDRLIPEPAPAEPAHHVACAELGRLLDALGREEIAFRRWDFEPAVRLVDGTQPAATPWLRRCLLQGTASAADLHYAFGLVDRPGAIVDGLAAMRPIMHLSAREPDAWRDLSGDRWHAVAAVARDELQRRVTHLGGLD